MSHSSTPLEVRIEQLPPMRVARFHARGQSPEAEAWAALRTWAESRGLLNNVAAHPLFGFNNPAPARPGAEYGYEFWLCLEPETRVESGIQIRDFPGGWFAVTTCTGPPNPAVWLRLWEWVRQSEYRHRPTHELERPHDPLALESELVFDLCLPIEPPAAASQPLRGDPGARCAI